ncbi:MAG: hypothetical protein M1831_006014 [Alyxoria varia]|nr:MAG: hypothetical protein M1831_006014 [Alyxoria varia]
MAATPPLTPATPLPPRRSVTLPMNPPPRQQRSSPDRSGDSLYFHPGATIFNFHPSPALLTSSNNADLNLPWATQFEKVAASGSLRLYKLNGFNGTWLKSGKLILNLFPKTQCWCVDGISKFAVRLQQTIYRIELPCESEEELAKVEEFKEALSKVLYYERTPCPFDRNFTVELPEDAKLPQTPRGMRGPKTKARRWEFDEGWRPEGEERPTTARSERSNRSSSDAESRSSATTEDTRASRKYSMPSTGVEDETKPPIRPRPMDMRRNFTAPPQAAASKPDDPFVAAPPSAARAAAGIVDTRRMSFNGDGAASNLSSHRPRTPQIQASPTPSPPSSPPSLEPESPVTPQNNSKQAPKPTIRNIDESTDTPAATASPQTPADKLATTTIHATDSTPSSTPPDPRRSSYSTSRIPSILPHPLDPTTPSRSSAVSPHNQPTTTLHPRPSQLTLTHRTSARLLRTMSSNPSAEPTGTTTTADTTTSLPRGLLTKTIALLLSPPSSLIEILVQIAERFARSATEWGGGAAYRIHEGSRRGVGRGPVVVAIPGGWEDDKEFDEADLLDVDEARKWEREMGAEDQALDGPSRSRETQKERRHRSRPSEDEYGVLDGDNDGEDEDEDDDLDDFGVPLGVDTPARNRRRDFGRGGGHGPVGTSSKSRVVDYSGGEPFNV